MIELALSIVIHSWWHQMRPNQKDLDDLRWQEAPWKQRLKGQTMRTNHFCYWTSTLLLWDTSACVCVCLCVCGCAQTCRGHVYRIYQYICICAHTHIYIITHDTWIISAYICWYLDPPFVPSSWRKSRYAEPGIGAPCISASMALGLPALLGVFWWG